MAVDRNYLEKLYAQGEGIPSEFNLATIGMAKKRAEAAIDSEYLDRLHDLRLFAAGHQESGISQARSSTSSESSTDVDGWPEYGIVKPAIEDDGVQNHALVSARINIQAVAYADPEFIIKSDVPEVKMYNEAWIKRRWEQNNWGDKFYDVGMDVEVCGFGAVEHGVNEGGFVDLEYVDPTDVVWDPTVKAPSDARYVIRRERIPVEDAVLAFPDLDEEEIKLLCKERTYSTAYSPSVADDRHSDEPSVEFVYAFSYWDENSHAIFLGSIKDPVAVMIHEAASGEYVKVGDKDSPDFDLMPLGLNPFGRIPLTFWVDSSLPGSNKPQSKMYTTAPIAKMLSDVERYIVRTVDRGIPMSVLATGAMDTETVKNIKTAIESGRSDVLEVIVSELPFNNDTVQRIPGAEIPQTVLQLRQILKTELNAATGVMDAQRGQALPGDKTAYEVRTLFSSQGVQARHLRRRFARFVQQCVYASRWIGALYETVPDNLLTDDSFRIDTETFTRDVFLSEDVEIIVNENSLQYRDPEEMFQARIAQFRAVEQPGIQLGVLDPVAVFKDLYNRIGRPQDAERLIVPPAPQEQVVGGGVEDSRQGQDVNSVGAMQELIALAGQNGQGN